MATTNEFTLHVNDIVQDKNLTKAEKVKSLSDMYEHARAEQRAATESPMIDDDGLNDSLSEIEKALAQFGEQPSKFDNRAATL